MGIKGLTDRQAAFPEIGQIRKGAPKPEDGKRPGADLKWFRTTFDEMETEAAAIFARTYGEHPTEIDVLLPFNTPAENFEAWREAYVAGGLTHRCDGDKVWYELDAQGQRSVVAGVPDRTCDRSRQCKPVGRLKVLVPQLQRLAFLTVLTSSIHDIMNLQRQLDALHQINGKLAGVPLKLRRRPVMISTPSGSNGQRARREKWLLSIEADPAWVKAKLLAMKAAALPGNHLGEDVPLLEAPDEPDEPEEGAWTQTTFDAGEDPTPAAPASTEAPAPPKPTNGKKPDPATDYWTAVNKANFDRETGKRILEESGGDFVRALEAVQKQVPPEDCPF